MIFENEQFKSLPPEDKLLVVDAAFRLCESNGHPTFVAAILDSIPEHLRDSAYVLYADAIQKGVDKNKEKTIEQQ